MVEADSVWKRRPLTYTYSDEVINPSLSLKRYMNLQGDAIITTEVSQNQMWQLSL
jgi:hypothetical protein